jgi:hypothetical protein
MRSCQDKERERERKKRERKIFFLRSDLRKKEACDWKEGRKERRKRGTRGTRGQMDMDGWIWVNGHMGEHFRGTGGR